jgi:hypothetical protein
MKATSNEDPNKLNRMKDLLGKELFVAPKPLSADYIWDAHGKVVAVEVKWSVSDLLSSLQTTGEVGGPRLAVEVRKILAFADVPLLLVPALRSRQADGKVLILPDRVSGWDYNSVKGILADVALYGCIVDEWEGDIARRLAQWYYTTRDPSHEWIRQRGRPEFISLDPLYSEAVWMLCSAPGIGPVTAEALLKEFGSVSAVVQATEKELVKVKGVGPRTAASLYKVLNQRWS